MPRRYAYECEKCGTEVQNIWNNCPGCGNEIDQSMFYGKVQGAPKPPDTLRRYWYNVACNPFELMMNIPVNEIESLIDEGKIDAQVLEDHPNGIDINVKQGDYEEFQLTYSYLVRAHPEDVRAKFIKDFLPSLSGSGTIPAYELE